MDYNTILNPSQVLPVLQTDGAVLVLAGAGSGKTRVLTYRIYHIAKDLNVPERNILAITFTNKAANEMKQRLSDLSLNVSDMWICTIHSMCTKMLRMFASEIGFTKDFSIYGDDEKTRILKSLDVIADDFLKKLRFHISNAKNNGLSPIEYAYHCMDKDSKEIARFYALYQDRLKANNAMDFDDLLLNAYLLLKTSESAREYFTYKFQYIHIDEFQDTNIIQYKLAKLLASRHNNLFVVGDDDQSIYGFRGANVENIFSFQKDFPSCKIFKLEQNYRSTKKILDAANLIIQNNSQRMSKTLYTENDEGATIEFNESFDESKEANYVINTINSLHSYSGYRYSDMAILIRINALSRSFEQEAIKYGITTKIFGGFKFYERKEIKDIAAYLQCITNPFDEESLLRIINVPRRGIGNSTIQALYSLKSTSSPTLYDVILGIETNPRATNALIKKVLPFKELLVNLIIENETSTLSELVKYLIDTSGIYSMYSGTDEENYNKRRNIDEFQNAVNEFEKTNANATLTELLTNITLDSELASEQEENDKLTIATVHACKGLEFKVVFVVGLDEGIFPISRQSDVDICEERRLMYVAITRAKERLYLTRAQTRFLYGERQEQIQSKFLSELNPILNIKKRSQNYSQGTLGYSNQKNSGYTKTAFRSNPYSNLNKTESIANNFSRSKATNTQEKPKKDLSKFTIGSKIKHKAFGVGTIINIKNDNYNTYCDVAFIGIGIKTLALEFAPIEIIN